MNEGSRPQQHRPMHVIVDNEDKLKRIKDANKRPLLIEFSNGHIKNVVMEHVTKLGSAKDRFEGIKISHDMTQKGAM